jgi:hypothetical protein
MKTNKVLELKQIERLKASCKFRGVRYDAEIYDNEARKQMYLSRLPDFSREFSDHFVVDEEYFASGILESFNRLPTPYQDPTVYDKMTAIFVNINNALKGLDPAKYESIKSCLPMYGSLQYGDFQNSYISNKDDRPLIIQYDSVYHFTEVLCKNLSFSLCNEPVRKEKTFKMNFGSCYDNIQSDVLSQMRFVDIMLCLDIFKEPYESLPERELSFAQRNLSLRLQDTINTFYFSHEYSHFLNNDNPRENDLTVLRNQELNADIRAFDLTNQIMRTRFHLDNDSNEPLGLITFAGVSIAFFILFFIDYLNQTETETFDYSMNSQKRHPTTQSRTDNFLKNVIDNSKCSDGQLSRFLFIFNDLKEYFNFLLRTYDDFYSYLTDKLCVFLDKNELYDVELRIYQALIYYKKSFIDSKMDRLLSDSDIEKLQKKILFSSLMLNPTLNLSGEEFYKFINKKDIN